MPCHFCSKLACEICNRSKRSFPEQVVGNDLGKICVICDRKYLMENYQETKVKAVIDMVEDIEVQQSTY